MATLAMAAQVVVATATEAWSNELQAQGDASRFVIHGPEQTLAEFCSRDGDGRLWLALPGGARYELITSTSDPAISNPGDGAFHPFQESEVRAALEAVSFPIQGLTADVFLLPYPRRAGLESAAGQGLVLLAPGVRPLSPQQQHAEFVHELGHVVHRALMPDSSASAWSAYRELRGITDPIVYAASAPHANRPHEIFAEDFRALFGDPLATYSGTIENSTIAPPSQVSGLRPFLRALAPHASVALALAARPNPARDAVEFARSGGAAAVLDVFDARGRRVASVAPTISGGLVRWRWDGTDARGRAAGAGAFYARPRDAATGGVRVIHL
jgi:hypothetical protein